MLAGGSESAVEALGLIGFSRLRALSSRAAAEKECDEKILLPSRPFDSLRDGFVLSEGAAMLVLEEHEHAVSRGANVLAEVVGVGYSGDGYHITAPEPEGKGAARAMLNAVSDASIDMNHVDYINAHATSTPVGDVAEIRAIQLALSKHEMSNAANPLLVSSTKGAVGHLLGASGAIEAVITVLCVQNQVAPHTQNLTVISEDILQVISEKNDYTNKAIHLVQHKPLHQDIQFAMSNSFGFGGTNASLLFARYST
jgi:3-oxoacyl-[acyl-carrier-protein] synthase II